MSWSEVCKVSIVSCGIVLYQQLLNTFGVMMVRRFRYAYDESAVVLYLFRVCCFRGTAIVETSLLVFETDMRKV